MASDAVYLKSKDHMNKSERKEHKDLRKERKGKKDRWNN